jgi:hypothetical protein
MSTAPKDQDALTADQWRICFAWPDKLPGPVRIHHVRADGTLVDCVDEHGRKGGWPHK